MHMGKFWMIYWVTPNNPMGRRYIKGTQHHTFMRHRQKFIISFWIKVRKVRGCLHNGCRSMLLKYSIPRSWKININGEQLLSKHPVVG